jgi:hypothetical protein
MHEDCRSLRSAAPREMAGCSLVLAELPAPTEGLGDARFGKGVTAAMPVELTIEPALLTIPAEAGVAAIAAGRERCGRLTQMRRIRRMIDDSYPLVSRLVKRCCGALRAAGHPAAGLTGAPGSALPMGSQCALTMKPLPKARTPVAQAPPAVLATARIRRSSS